MSIPDANLRAAIERSLNKTSSATITPADMLTLTTLRAPDANISNLTGLEYATNLTVLDLSDNRILNLAPLAGLTNLTSLGLSNNRLSDLTPLVSNTGLGRGDEVYVQNNPLSNPSLNTHIPALQGRGVTVQFDSTVESPVFEGTVGTAIRYSVAGHSRRDSAADVQHVRAACWLVV